MNAIYAALICAGTAILCSHLKKRWPELALGVAAATGVAVIAAFWPDMKNMLASARDVAKSSGMDQTQMTVMIRACGISLVAEFASQICKDAGESALSGRILLCARLAMLALAAPVVTSILSRLSQLLSL